MLNLRNDLCDSLVDAALERHRVCTGGNRADAFFKDSLCENGRGRCAVTGNVAGLAGDFADHLCAHVLERVLELDLFSDGHTVFGDRRRTKLFVDNNVAALWSERNFHRVRELVDTAQDSGT